MKIDLPLRGEIHIELSDDGDVRLIASQSLSISDLASIHSFWSPEEGGFRISNVIKMSPADFESRAVWLREVWSKNGRTVTYDPSVTNALRDVREGISTFQSILLEFPSRHIGKRVEIEGISRELTPEQHENVLCLLDMPNGANFSVPGAGKTLTTLSVWLKLKKLGKVDAVLVVCPRSAFDSWQTEVKDSIVGQTKVNVYQGGFVDPSTDFLLVNYEQLENPEKLQKLKSWISYRKGHLVIDEAHRVKGGGRSVRWRALKELAPIAARVDILTGTPMPNGPQDVRSLFQLVWPKLSGSFLTEDVLVGMPRKTAYVRTTKSELRLPDVTYRVASKKPSPLQAEILGALKDKYVGLFGLSVLESKNLARKGKAVMTILAAATNPGLLVPKDFQSIEFGFNWPPLDISEDKDLMQLIRDYLNHEQPWKFKFVARQAEELQADGRKLLVWSSFVGNIAALSRILTKFRPAVVYGGIDQQTRESEIRRFREDPSCGVLITNPQTLGEGISLHKVCHDAIYLDRTYNAGMYLQSIDRIHRLGLPSDTITNITLLQTRGTIDDRVAKRLEQKIRNLSHFLQDTSLVQASIPDSDEIPAQEIFGLEDEDLNDIFKFWES